MLWLGILFLQNWLSSLIWPAPMPFWFVIQTRVHGYVPGSICVLSFNLLQLYLKSSNHIGWASVLKMQPFFFFYGCPYFFYFIGLALFLHGLQRYHNGVPHYFLFRKRKLRLVWIFGHKITKFRHSRADCPNCITNLHIGYQCYFRKADSSGGVIACCDMLLVDWHHLIDSLASSPCLIPVTWECQEPIHPKVMSNAHWKTWAWSLQCWMQMHITMIHQHIWRRYQHLIMHGYETQANPRFFFFFLKINF
jgi:hypothetical protein